MKNKHVMPVVAFVQNLIATGQEPTEEQWRRFNEDMKHMGKIGRDDAIDFGVLCVNAVVKRLDLAIRKEAEALRSKE